MKTRFVTVAALTLAMPMAFAGTYDIKEMTPAVQQALNNRQGRFAELAAQKAAGTIGEDNEGHVQQLGGGADVAALVSAENADREAIYTAIVQQNGLPADAITTVRHVFAETQRNRAAPGDRTQLPSGEWVKQ